MSGESPPSCCVDWYYHNRTDSLVVLRCDEEDVYFEKVVFPFDVVNFDAPADAKVMVWGHCNGSVDVLDSFVVSEGAEAVVPPAPLTVSESAATDY